MKTLIKVFKPGVKKIVLTIGVTILHMVLILSIPVLGYRDRLSSLTGTQLILTIITNFLFNAVAYYLFFCGLIGFIKAIKKPIQTIPLIIFILIILISNPAAIYFYGNLLEKNQIIQQQKSVNCGQEIVSFAEFSKASSSGLVIGDIVTAVDGTEIVNINNLIENSKNKQAGDITNLQTSRGIFKVEIVNNPATNSPAMGISFKDVICP